MLWLGAAVAWDAALAAGAFPAVLGAGDAVALDLPPWGAGRLPAAGCAVPTGAARCDTGGLAAGALAVVPGIAGAGAWFA
ncbi:MAG: hypothetical protein M0Z27_11815 [Thermaerobacter sp.]|nr:hypothetical protein [Thermaerobacter sp.]